MRNILRSGLALLALLGSQLTRLSAQNTFTYDSSFNNQMTVAFDSLNLTRIPTGILQDFAMEFTNLAAYNGTNLADSCKTTALTVPDIYNTLASGVISTNAHAMVHPFYFDSVWQTQRQAGMITCAGVLWSYGAITPNAVANGLITVANNKLTDKYVNGVWQNPYVTQTVFAVSPSVNAYNSYGTHAMQVVLPANCWLSDGTVPIGSFSVDFGDGQGARSLPLGQVFNVAYASGGTKTWTFVLNLLGGGTLTSRTDIRLDSTAELAYNVPGIRSGSLASAGQKRKWWSRYGAAQSAPIGIVATTPVYGQYASGFMTILYANADQKIRNPLIVAEGFDPGDVLTPEQLTGEQSLQDFLQNAVASGSTNFSNLVLGGTYDIIYVDWRHGTDFIERNAKLLEAVIAYVNKNKITTTSNTLIGQSMGALVARYALKDLENQGVAHQTSLFISWDGPHQGANVPLAYQYMSRQARSLYLKTSIPSVFNFYTSFIHPLPSSFVTTVMNLSQLYAGSPYASAYTNVYVGNVVDAGLNLQDFPAAREMLIDFLNTNQQVDNSIHTSWQTTLTNLGYPKGNGGITTKVIAVSNGSECGTTETFTPGQAMFDIRGSASTSFLGEIVGQFALPFAAGIVWQPSLFLSVLPGYGQVQHPVLLLCPGQRHGVPAIRGHDLLYQKDPVADQRDDELDELECQFQPVHLALRLFPGWRVSLTDQHQQQFLFGRAGEI
jgi:hypothetical protein